MGFFSALLKLSVNEWASSGVSESKKEEYFEAEYEEITGPRDVNYGLRALPSAGERRAQRYERDERDRDESVDVHLMHAEILPYEESEEHVPDCPGVARSEKYPADRRGNDREINSENFEQSLVQAMQIF